MPDDDRYCAVLGIVTERLDIEFINLMPLALRPINDAQASTNGNAA